MTKPVHYKHDGIAGKPALSARKNCKREPYVGGCDHFIFSRHRSFLHSPNIIHTGVSVNG